MENRGTPYACSVCARCHWIVLSDHPRFLAKTRRHGCARCKAKGALLSGGTTIEDVVAKARDLIQSVSFSAEQVEAGISSVRFARERLDERTAFRSRSRKRARRRKKKQPSAEERQQSRRSAIRTGRAATVAPAALARARVAAAEAGRPKRLDIPCSQCGTTNRCSFNGWGRNRCRTCGALWVVVDDRDREPSAGVASNS
jgi:hypothetical protein